MNFFGVALTIDPTAPRPVPFRERLAALLLIGVGLIASEGCAPPPRSPTVADAAARQQHQAVARAAAAPSASPQDDRTTGLLSSSETGLPARGDAIATVDGRPINRQRLVDLLLAGHGVGMLEQLVVLERAKKLAAEQGILVTPKDIDAEYERSLRNLLSPLEAADDTVDFDRAEGERLLDEVLARRNVSRAECMDVVERNAYLRALVNSTMKFTEQEINEEYLRLFSKQAEIRHIQVRGMPEAQKAAELLKAGEDFATVAKNYSSNLRTGPSGGLLPPFAQNDASIPKGLRDLAFRLAEGEVSAPVRVDDWYQIVRLERMIPAERKELAEVRPEIELRLRKRLSEPAMQALYRQLFEQADIRIDDPVLAAEFARKHPNRLAKSP